jgi:hypothetical protein
MAYPNTTRLNGQPYLAASATAVVLNELFSFPQYGVDMQAAVNGREVYEVLSTYIGVWCFGLV